MEDQIVSLETAKLAKEKGFDIHNYNSKHYLEYLEDEVFDDPRKGHEIILKHKGDIICGSTSLVTVKHDSWIAPSQSLLQRWLREKYNLYVEVTVESIVNGLVVYQVEIKKEDKDDPTTGVLRQRKIAGLTNYEEILDIGLNRALEEI